MSNIVNVFRKQKSDSAIDNRIMQFRDQDGRINKAYEHKLLWAFANSIDKGDLLLKWKEYKDRMTKLAIA
jgi:hypothetical protein